MLSFFRSNNPGVVVFYVVYLILFRVIFFFTTPDFSFVFNHHEPLAALIFKPLSNLQDYKIVGSLLGAVVIFLEAILINGIYNVNKFSAKKTYLPGAIFIIVASFFTEGLVFSPAMLSSLFVALIVYRLFGLIKQDKVNGDIFDVGFLTAVASLTYFPSALLIFFSLLALTTIRPFSLRDWMIVLLGFLAPLIPVVIIYFWFDKLDKLPLDALNIIHFEWLVGFENTTVNIVLSAVLGLLLSFSFIMLPSVLFSTLIQVRKFSSTLVLLAFFVIGGFFLQPQLHSAHWVILALPAGILYTMALEQFKRKIIVEITHLILILLILAGQYLPLLNII